MKKNNKLAFILSMLLSMILIVSSVGAVFAAPATPAGGTGNSAEDSVGNGDTGDDGDASGSDNGGSDDQNGSGNEQSGNAGTAGTDEEAADKAADPAEGKAKGAEPALKGSPDMETKGDGDEDEDPKYTGDPVDLKTGNNGEGYITGYTIYRRGPTDLNWTEVDDENPVRSDDDVRFVLSFELPPKTLQTIEEGEVKETNKAEYKIEIKGEHATIEEGSGTMKDSSGKTIGTYVVEKTDPKEGDQCGIIKVTFTDEYVDNNNGHHGADKGSRIGGNVEFISPAASWGTNIDTEVIHISNSTEDVSLIVVDPTVAGDIKITKTASGDTKTGELTYKLTVTSNSGTSGDITITDNMSGGTRIKGTGNFTVKKDGEASEYKTLVDQDGHEITEGDTGFVMTLGQLGENGKYEITYEAYYPGLVSGKRSVKNTAIAASTHIEGEEQEPKHIISSAHCVTNLEYYPVTKAGTDIMVDEHEGHLYVNWTVTINPGGANIKDWMLKDKGYYDKSSENHFLTAEDVSFVRYEKGSEEGEPIEINTQTLDGNNVIYTFPGYPDGSDTNTCRYVLKYTTKIDFDQYDAHSADNIAILEHPEYEDISSNTVGVDGLGSGNDMKDSEYVNLVHENGKWYAVIGWKVKVHAQYSSIAVGSRFTDHLGSGQKYRDPAALKAAAEVAFRAKGVGITWDQDHDPEITETDYQFTLDNKLEKGNEVEFTYESVFEFTSQKAMTMARTFDNTFELPDVEREGKGRATYNPLLQKFGVLINKSNNRETRYPDDIAKYVGDGDLSLIWDVDVNLPHNYYSTEGQSEPEVDAVMIEDTLPPGVELRGFSLKVDSTTYDFQNIASSSEEDPVVIRVGDDEGETVSAWYVPPAADENSGLIRVKLGRAAFTKLGEKKYTFRVRAEVRDDFTWEYNDKNIKTHKFDNLATLYSEKDGETEELLSDTQAQTLTNDEHANAVIKSCTYKTSESLRVVPYNVIVNKEGKDLVAGSDTIEFIDTLKAEYPENGISVTLVPDSVRIYKYDPDPITGPKGEDITDEVGYEHIPGEKSGDEWTIRSDLPDATALYVEYQYYMSGFTTGREVVKLRNTSSIYGVATISGNGNDNEDIQVLTQGSGETERVIFHKVDMHNNNIALDGAVFDAYKYNVETGEYEYVSTLPPSHVEELEDGRKVHGEIVFNEGNLGERLQRNVAYRLIENTPPAGYRLDKTPTDFMIVDRDTDKHPICIPEDFNGYRVGFHDASIYLKNEAYTPLQITKVNKDGKPLKGAVFDLYAVNPDGEVRIPFTDYKGNLISEGNETDSKGRIIFPNWVDPGDYYLIETTAPGGGYLAWDEAIHFRYDGHVTFLFDNKFYITQKKSPGGLAPYEVEITDYVPEVKVEKEASSETARRGDVITYTVRVKNTGKVNVYDYLITDTPVAGIEYVSDDGGGTFKDGAVTWKRDIRSGETVTIHVNARVTENAGFITVNNVTVTGGDIDKAYVRVVKSGANTGDSSRTVLWAALLIAAAAGCIIMIVRRRRNN